MKQEDKQLLLQDLCSRLPYKVMIQSVGENKCLGLMDLADIDSLPKPYLRSMSSMTEKEKKIYSNFFISKEIDNFDFDIPNYDTIDWLNAHHFDYRGLISKNLALEASEGMYNLR